MIITLLAHDRAQDCELLAEDLERLGKSYKSVVQLELGEEFPRGSQSAAFGEPLVLSSTPG